MSLLDEAAALGETLERRYAEKASDRFTPSSKQRIALAAVLKYPIVLMVGANGIGKSTALVHEADAW